MDLSADLSEALLRRETKAQIAKLLNKLSAADRRAVLLDLVAEEKPAAAEKPPHVAPRSERPRRGRPTKKRVSRSGANGQSSQPGRTETLIATLTEKPRIPIRELAVRVYGDDKKSSQDRTRSLMAALKGQGRVRNVGPGQWEAVT